MQFITPNQIHISQKGKYVRFPKTMYLTDWNTKELKTVVIEAGSIGLLNTLIEGNSKLLIALNKDKKTAPSRTSATTFGYILVKIGIGDIEKIQMEA